jgi:hypothetical protein
MRHSWLAGFLAAGVALSPAAEAAARKPAKAAGQAAQSKTIRHSYIRPLGLEGLDSPPRGGRKGHVPHYVALVGDPGSGLGFYPLPLKYRMGAWRYKMRHQRPPWQNPVLFAIAADAMRYYNWVPANEGYRAGVFNPIDGVGTPFFGGYYSAGEDDDMPPRPPYPD